MEFEGVGLGQGNLELFYARVWEIENLIEKGGNIYEEYEYKRIPLRVIEKDDF